MTTALLRDNLTARAYSPAHLSTGITLYHSNLRNWHLLRYGIPVQIGAGQEHETVDLIDWEHTPKRTGRRGGINKERNTGQSAGPASLTTGADHSSPYPG